MIYASSITRSTVVLKNLMVVSHEIHLVVEREQALSLLTIHFFKAGNLTVLRNLTLLSPSLPETVLGLAVTTSSYAMNMGKHF